MSIRLHNLTENSTGTHFSLEVKKTSCCTLTKQSKISQHDQKRFLSEKSLKEVIIAITCLSKSSDWLRLLNFFMFPDPVYNKNYN